MASNYKETHKVNIKGILNLEDGIIEMENGGSIEIYDVFRRFNGEEVGIVVQLIKELDK